MKFGSKHAIMQIQKTSSFFLVLFFLICDFNLFANPPLLPKGPVDQTYVVGIDKKHKFVWFRVAKVASSTIKDVFRRNRFHLFYSENFSFKSGKYKDYFKFAFVRNPWARVVSCYCQKVENKNPKWEHYYGECFDKGFDYFVDFIDRKDLWSADRHIRLQTALIPVNEVDFVGRLETFDEDFRYVLQILNVQNHNIPKKNATQHQHYSCYYNERTREIIARKYKDDIEAFGYVFETKH